MKNRPDPSFARAMLRGFGIVVLAMIVAVAVRKLLLGALGTHIIWVTFYPAVVIASFYGGWLAGLLCAAASCFFARYGWPWFGDAPFLKDHWSWLGMVSFLINCATISAVVEIARRARRRAIQTAEQAKAAVHALEAENLERARAEQQLRWKTAFLEAQVNSSIDAIMLVDPDRKLALHNQLFIDLFKIPAHLADEKDTERRLRWIADMTTNPEQYFNLVNQVYARAEESRRDEFDLKDGRILDRYTAPVVGKDGAFYGRIWIFRDITERKKAELEIERLAAFPRFNPNPVLELSSAGDINYCNHAAEAMVRDFGRETPAQMLPPDIAAIVRKCLAADSPKLRVEEQIGTRVISWSFFPVKFNNTVHCYGGDITERKRTEEALRQSEEHLRAMFDVASVGIAQADPRTGQWLRVNKKMCDITGYSADELLGMRVADITHVEDRQPDHKAFERVVRGEAPNYRMEKRYVRKDGVLAWVNINMTVIRDATGQATRTMAIIEDITESKRAQAKLESMHKQLVESSRLAGMAEIATNVLHNVGNALNSVNISTDLILDGIKNCKATSLAKVVDLLQQHAHELGAFLTDDTGGRNVPVYLARFSEHLMAEQRNIMGELDSLRRNVDHIKAIVAMQQDYAAVAGMKEMSDVASLVEDSIRLNEDALRRHGVEIVRELKQVPPMNIEKHKILQILVNLVRNAKDACSDAARPDKRLTVCVGREDGRVKITVMDNGIGIPPENLTRIFNFGFTTRKDGHGFGLHGSALAAKEMGGSLTVRSNGPGQGAAFTLELPCPKQEIPHE